MCACVLIDRIHDELLSRCDVFDRYFGAEAQRMARLSLRMAERFRDGGRLIACGSGAAATDAQHVSVEFVHPVIMGKRALPALDASYWPTEGLLAALRPADMVMRFAFPPADSRDAEMLCAAQARGALTIGLASTAAEYDFTPPSRDGFVCQEVYEALYHMLWETVHVFLEHREQGHDVGAPAFLYPFLGESRQPLDVIIGDVEASMRQKVEEVNSIRRNAAERASETLSEVAAQIRDRVDRGGKLILFGNGGSATDANDIAQDCLAPPPGWAPIPAVSLAAEPAVLSAIANDVGVEAVFTRQVAAHASANDVAIGISTSGSSANILGALQEARKQGLLTVAFAGYDGGRVVRERLADYCVVVSSDYIPRIQEVQASLYHVLLTRLEDLRRTSHA